MIGRNRLFQKIGGTVHGIHILMDDPPHVAALATENPLDAKAFCFGINLGVESLDHLVGGEEAEVSPFGGIRAESVVQADFVEEHQVSHAGVCSRVGKVVARWCDKENIGAFFVDRNFHANSCPVKDIVGHEFEHVLDTAGLNAQVVARPKAVCRRFDDPVDIAADKIQKLTPHHGNLRLVNAEGTEGRTPAAFSALVEIIEPLLEDVDGEITRAGEFAEKFTRRRKVAAIDGAQKFRTQDGHVLRIT